MARVPVELGSQQTELQKAFRSLFSLSTDTTVEVSMDYEPHRGGSSLDLKQGGGVLSVSYNNPNGDRVQQQMVFAHRAAGREHWLDVTAPTGMSQTSFDTSWKLKISRAQVLFLEAIKAHQEAELRKAAETERVQAAETERVQAEQAEVLAARNRILANTPGEFDFGSSSDLDSPRVGDADSTQEPSITGESLESSLGSLRADLGSFGSADTSLLSLHSSHGGRDSGRKPADSGLLSMGGAHPPGSQPVSRVASFFRMIGSAAMVVASAARLLASPLEALLTAYVVGGDAGMTVFSKSAERVRDWAVSTARAARELNTGESIAPYAALRSEDGVDRDLDLESSISLLEVTSVRASPRTRPGSMYAAGARSPSASQDPPLGDAGMTAPLREQTPQSVEERTKTPLTPGG